MIGFWKTKRLDFSVSHQKGLDEQQIAFLHSLKVGDRLKLWENNNVENHKSNFTLGKLEEGSSR